MVDPVAVTTPNYNLTRGVVKNRQSTSMGYPLTRFLPSYSGTITLGPIHKCLLNTRPSVVPSRSVNTSGPDHRWTGGWAGWTGISPMGNRLSINSRIDSSSGYNPTHSSDASPATISTTAMVSAVVQYLPHCIPSSEAIPSLTGIIHPLCQHDAIIQSVRKNESSGWSDDESTQYNR